MGPGRPEVEAQQHDRGAYGPVAPLGPGMPFIYITTSSPLDRGDSSRLTTHAYRMSYISRGAVVCILTIVAFA